MKTEPANALRDLQVVVWFIALNSQISFLLNKKFFLIIMIYNPKVLKRGINEFQIKRKFEENYFIAKIS